MPLEIPSSQNQRDAAPTIGEQGAALLSRLNAKERVTSRERMFFTEQLSLMLETGGGLLGALQALRLQSDHAGMIKLIQALEQDISEGKPFSYALSRHPDVFSSTYVNLVAASESGGFMHEVLTQLLQMEEKREKLRSTMMSAFSYPAFLVFFSFAVVVFVLTVVFPKFSDMFSTIEDQLPATTKVLMAASTLLTEHWLPLLIVMAGFFMLLLYWTRLPAGIEAIDRVKLRFPGLRDIFIQLYLVQSLRVMSLSLQHGVSIVDTLTSCRDVVRNHLFQRFISQVESQVQQGAGISVGFSNSPFVPAIVEQMIRTGEESGNLPKVMARVADHYEREMGRRLTALSKLAEPIMLLVMGVVVGILVSSLILPIFKLSRAVH